MSTLEFLHLDTDLAVLNKPANLSLFADRQSDSCLWDLLKDHFGAKGQKIYQVHRIDKGTSGVLVVALSKQAQAELNKQFNARSIKKAYLAICLGRPEPAQGLIDLPLCPGRKSRYRVAGQRDAIYLDSAGEIPVWQVPPDPQLNKKSYPSQSYYTTLLSQGAYSLILVKPITGRTHQIRVHLSWLGHPLLGEHLYGTPKETQQQAERLALHSYQLQCVQQWQDAHNTLKFTAPLPPFFKAALGNSLHQLAAENDLETWLNQAVQQLNAYAKVHLTKQKAPSKND